MCRSSLRLRADVVYSATMQYGKAISSNEDQARCQQGKGKCYEDFVGLKNLTTVHHVEAFFHFAVYFESYKHETWKNGESSKCLDKIRDSFPHKLMPANCRIYSPLISYPI